MTDTRLRRVRWGVRGALLLGVATSVAANVLHARPNPISQAIAAWPPLALLLTVELISRIPVHRRSLAAVRLGATASIAGIAAWVSYWHMAGVAARYGEVGAAPYLMPLSVDGLVVVASVCLVELAGRIQAADSEAVTTADAPADIEPDIKPAAANPRSRAPRKRDTGIAVARLRARHPNLSAAEIAKRLGVTDRTVRRHLSSATN
jgi:DNA-binding CsgD family transcriptional regulator